MVGPESCLKVRGTRLSRNWLSVEKVLPALASVAAPYKYPHRSFSSPKRAVDGRKAAANGAGPPAEATSMARVRGGKCQKESNHNGGPESAQRPPNERQRAPVKEKTRAAKKISAWFEAGPVVVRHFAWP